MKIFSVDLSKINISDLVLLGEVALISPYRDIKDEALIIGKFQKTGKVFSKTIFSLENGEKKEIKEDRETLIFHMNCNKDNYGKINKKIYRDINKKYFIVVYDKEELKELAFCHVKEGNISEIIQEEWLGVETTHMENIFSEINLIQASFERLPMRLEEPNMSNLLVFLNIHIFNVEQISVLTDMIKKAERVRENKHGDNFTAYPLSENDFISIFGSNSGLPFYIYEALECFFNDHLFEYSKDDALGCYYNEIISKLEKSKKIIDLNRKD